jgi:glyoxylase-like metal-dependent hydrolase (beta-lactamase superfamily II)
MDCLLKQMGEWLQINGVPPDQVPQLQTASVGAASYVAPTYPDTTLNGGETISTGAFTFQVMWTPGHSPGHICLYEPDKKIYFSGDHILPTITPNIGIHPQSSDNPLGDFMNSLEATRQLDISLVMPGHESPFTKIRARIRQLVQHHAQRNSEILTTIKTEAKTGYQIAKGVIWMADIGGVGLHDLAPLHRRLAILETLAHLESMRPDGKVEKFSRNGIIYYQRT